MMLKDLHCTRFSDTHNFLSFKKLFALSVISMMGFIAPLKATNFTVTNTNDNGPGSFRAAAVSAITLTLVFVAAAPQRPRASAVAFCRSAEAPPLVVRVTFRLLL